MGEMTRIGTGSSGVEAYLAVPDGEVQGAVLVIHEVWGLVDHIKNVADRFAAGGYLALAPDLLSGTGLDVAAAARLGERMADPAQRADAQPQLRAMMSPLHAPGAAEAILAGARSCVDYLAARADVAGRIAVVGFCLGGTYAYSLAVHEPRLRAVVPFYGHADFTPEELRRISAPILAFYGVQDRRLVDELPQLRLKMHDAGVDFRDEVYSGTGHAFFNDTNAVTYNAAAAADAWHQTLNLLDTTLA